ncbi:MAG: hypothetical protein V3R99_01605 [Thermoguttaceae bacterium]
MGNVLLSSVYRRTRTVLPCLVIVACWYLSAWAQDHAKPTVRVELAGERLMAASSAVHGRVYLATPSAEEMLHTSGKPIGEVMLYKPARQGEALTVTLPVEVDGYYRLVGTHVYGAWKQGRYGLYRAHCDGIALPGKHHGWYGAAGPPSHWPKAKTHLVDVDWGVIHLRRPHVEVTFTSTDDGLLGTGRIALQPVPVDELKREDRDRVVPTRVLASDPASSRSRLKDVQVVGRNGRFMEDLTRYDPQQRADRMLRSQVAVTRQSYLDFIYDDSTYGAKAMASGPDRGQYGVRHAFPALAHYAASGDARLARGIKSTLHAYDRNIRRQVAEQNWQQQYMFDPTLLCMYRRVFQQQGDWSEEDEAWFKEFFVWLCRTVHVWGGPEHFWRGPMHRSTGEGIMKLLAVTMYPDIPEADQWRRYAELQWNDWWEFRDNPINDTGYFYGQIFPIVLGAHLLGREEVFTDPQMRKFWDRLIDTTSPDGAVVPFGPSSGWNSDAGTRLMAMEMAARYTGDGRYRFVAHRLFNNLLFQADVYRTHHMLDHFSQLGLAVAYLVADESIEPLEPSAASTVLYHKETLRVGNKEGAAHYLPELDRDPAKAHIDCGLLCTSKVLPFKLCLRSGWQPGDLYMLVDLFPRHEPMNPTGILGISRYNSVLGHAIDSKGLTDWLNMFRVEDLSGTASCVVNSNPNTVDAYYMEVTVPTFKEHRLATYAAVDVKDYNGYPMTLRREFLFVKNRFCLVRDTATFRERFDARIGPNWYTQNVGPQVGNHWANTYFTAPIAHGRKLHNPQVDLLVYHAPHAERQLIVSDDTADVRRLKMPYTLRYVWEGTVEPQRAYSFAHLLLPGLPEREAVRSNAPGAASLADISGQYMAAGITVLKDNADQSVWRITSDEGREEWCVLNPTGKPVEVDGLTTDAHQVYLDIEDGRCVRAMALSASYLKAGTQEIIRQPKRTDFEK